MMCQKQDSFSFVFSDSSHELARGQMTKYLICLGNHLGNCIEGCSKMKFRSFMTALQASVLKTCMIALWMSHIGQPKKVSQVWCLNGQISEWKAVPFRNRYFFYGRLPQFISFKVRSFVSKILQFHSYYFILKTFFAGRHLGV